MFEKQLFFSRLTLSIVRHTSLNSPIESRLNLRALQASTVKHDLVPKKITFRTNDKM